MKKLFILFSLMLVFSFEIFSGERIENIDKKLLKSGIVYVGNEKVPYTGTLKGKNVEEVYKSGIKDGYFKGTVKIAEENLLYEGRYVQGIKHGVWYLKYKTGVTKAIMKYNYDRPHGHWSYFYPNKSMAGYENLKDGLLAGKVVQYNEDGSLKATVNYKNGLLEEEGTFFYNSGNLKAETNFRLGKVNGPIRIYSDGGTLLLDGHYINNRREGKWMMFYRNGDLKTTIEYKNGMKHGDLVIYDKSGMVLDVAQFKNGLEIGVGETKAPKLRDNIVGLFKKFNRDLKYEQYNKILTEME
ncbi:toxin-antitoxin system YwqK family antitoxin [Fusobacterium sp. MFO224]|uniref:toxin-antitoxin system YwqK family antitoxin n=1 Tax=Fusobacterium sp. MFO224 TaxID=3378070 RepID=UPI003854A540